MTRIRYAKHGFERIFSLSLRGTKQSHLLDLPSFHSAHFCHPNEGSSQDTPRSYHKMTTDTIKNNASYETKCPSPDGRENPFVPGFGIKDWKEQQEIAPNSDNDKKIMT